MSVFHKLYLGSELEFKQFKNWVSKYVSEKNMELFDSKKDYIIVSNGFTVFIDDRVDSVAFRSEDYGLNFNFNMYIDINPAYSNWAVELMEYAGKMLKDFDGDFVLESNGETAYLIRKKVDGKVIADNSYLGYFPFEHLGIEYRMEPIKQV